MLIPQGEYLCLEGNKAKTLFIVKSGSFSCTSKKNPLEKARILGPGSIFGEFSLLDNAPRESTLRALEDSEVIEIDQETLEQILQNKSSWIKSILTFLTGRHQIAKANKEKNDLIQALPSLLYIFSSHIAETGSDAIPLELLHQKIQVMNNTPADEVDQLLQSLQNLDLVKILGKSVHAKSLQIIPLLYETLQYRALNRKVSPNILSMTDQMILSTFVKLARESNLPLKDGICTIPTEQLRAEAKKNMHGFTLTMRTVAPLVQKKLLGTSGLFDIHAPLESIDFFYADFDKILDLLELNRIFPLLDKNL